MKIEKLTSFSQVKQKTNADVRQLGMVVSQRDEQVSTASQTVIDLAFAVSLDIKQNFLLFVDGAGPLVETSDFTFTSVSNNTSAQVTLTSPVIAGLNIEALLLGTQIAPFPNPSSVQADINQLKNPWTEVTGTTQAISPNNAYVANNGSQVVLTLPTTIAVGQFVKVAGKGSGGWKVAQNASQKIYKDVSTSTTGVTGYISSGAQFSCMELICIVANTEFVVINSQGVITVA